METKTIRRVRKFQIMKGSEPYKKLDELCLKSRNMYNYTLFILRNLNFASFPINGHEPEYYINQIDENIRKYIETEKKTINVVSTDENGKKVKEKKEITYYNIVVHSNKTENGKVSDEKALSIILCEMNQNDYRAVQSTGARNAVKLAFKSMKSYRKSIVDYLKNKSKYTGEPSLPRYRKNCFERVPFTVDTFRTDKNDNSITINGDIKLDNVYVEKGCNVKQIRVVPLTTQNAFNVEIVYEKKISFDSENEKESMAIDLGINNIAAISITNGNNLLINGRALKNINHYYNRESARLNTVYSKFGIKTGKKRKMLERKRHNKISTFMHQTSAAIIDIARNNHCGRIFIGHNEGWKQKVNIGRKNNQNFVQIPFNELISQIKYKGEEYGIEVKDIDEAYTSKCSALDNESIEKHKFYLGKRKGRHNKEFITSKNKLINADVNGSLNILRLGTEKDLSYETNSMFTTPKFNKVGFEKYYKCEMQPQNQNDVNHEDMAWNDAQYESEQLH